MRGDLGSRGKLTLDGRIIPPKSVIVGESISDVIQTLIAYYFPKAKVIYDPTVGEENYQFGSWIGSSPYDYIASDIKRTKWSNFLADVMKLPLRPKSVDVIVYDPPFVPYTHEDKRGSDYDINVNRSPLSTLDFYGEEVIKELGEAVRQGVIVRCQDFYYPTTTGNFFPMLPYVYFNVKKFFEVKAIHIYRFVNPAIQIYAYRLGRAMINNRRALICHSYLFIGYSLRSNGEKWDLTRWL